MIAGADVDLYIASCLSSSDDYVLDGASGKRTLVQLFEGRSAHDRRWAGQALFR